MWERFGWRPRAGILAKIVVAGWTATECCAMETCDRQTRWPRRTVSSVIVLLLCSLPGGRFDRCRFERFDRRPRWWRAGWATTRSSGRTSSPGFSSLSWSCRNIPTRAIPSRGSFAPTRSALGCGCSTPRRVHRAEGASAPAPWAARDGAVVAVTNAAMYQADGTTSTSLMRTADHVNNGHLSRDRTVLAFDRSGDAVPRIQIIDRTCQDFDSLRSSYRSLVQSIRMISCTRTNVWSQRDARWSTALIATDSAQRVLLIHVRSPYSTHDLIENLLALPIGIAKAMYLEGGRPAQLYIHAAGRELELVGSTGSSGLGGNRLALPFPNALALYRRASAGDRAP